MWPWRAPICVPVSTRGPLSDKLQGTLTWRFGMVVSHEDRGSGEHDWLSADYVDWWITRDLSRDAERRQRLREMLSHAGLAADAEFSVLDVGGGYGVVSEEVLAAFPHARVTLQDYSEPMLAQARERLAAHAKRTGFVLADLT